LPPSTGFAVKSLSALYCWAQTETISTMKAMRVKRNNFPLITRSFFRGGRAKNSE
jgi:hypothetical protein